MRAHVVLFAFVAVGSPLAACTTAPATEIGGTPRFDLTPPSAEAICAYDEVASTGEGHHFTDLYRDYFGPTAKSGCAGDSGNVGKCHGTADAEGAKNSGGYVCGETASACWQGMTQATLLADRDPASNGLVAVLRRCDGSRFMPKLPADFKFYAADLQRIDDWLAAGAPND